MSILENLNNIKYEDNLAKLFSLNIQSFDSLVAAVDYYNSLSEEEKQLIKNYDINNSIIEKIKFIIHTDDYYRLVKRYLECLNFSEIAKEENSSRQNINEVIKNRFLKLQEIVNTHNSSIDIKKDLVDYYKKLNAIKSTSIKKTDIVLELIRSNCKINRKVLKDKINSCTNITDQRFNSIIKQLREEKKIFQFDKDEFCSKEYLHNIYPGTEIISISNEVTSIFKELKVNELSIDIIKSKFVERKFDFKNSDYLLRDIILINSNYKSSNLIILKK